MPRMTASKRARGLAALAVAVLAAGVWATSAFAFSGAFLANPGAHITITNSGVAYPRLKCPGGTDGFCTGSVVLKPQTGPVSARKHPAGKAPVALRGNDAPTVQVPISASGRRAMCHGPVRMLVTITTHDSSGAYQTTTGTLLVSLPAHLRSKC
jgi:hypothetical protein